MVIDFSTFRTSDNETLNLFHALKYCAENHAEGLILDKDTYTFTSDFAFEKAMCVSNHGETGYRKTAFLLEGLDSFFIDGCGSTFVFTSVMNAFSVLNCKNVVLKNFTIRFPNFPYPDGTVTDVADDHFDVFFDHPAKVMLNGNTLCVESDGFVDKVHCDVRFCSDTKEVVYGTGDNSLGENINTLKKEEIAPNTFRIYNPSVMPRVSDVIGLLTGIRRASGIFIENSKNVTIENVVINSCIGIGIMSQLSSDILVIDCAVSPTENKYISSAADATHFVCCAGNITLKNSLFENMLDDALNVHGIYTKVVSSSKGSVQLKFMNEASIGIPIYKTGDEIAFLDPETLKPSIRCKIKSVTPINRHMTELEIDTDADILPGLVVENLSAYPTLCVDNCVIRNNRARGMLIATPKSAVVKNSTFHTSGSAIVLECDGKFWYESGAVNDLLIENNVFDNCRYANWDKGIISIPSNKETEDGYYYHGSIKVCSNVFKGTNDVDVFGGNMTELIYKDNTSENPVLDICHTKKIDVQENANIIK